MPLTPLRLKFLIYERGESITSLAEQFGCTREELSKTIRGVRLYPQIREKLASFLNQPVEQLFRSPKGRKRQAA